MLGLPDGIRGCLFDLDGVITKTATVHDAAWQEMFDSYLRERSQHTGEPFVPFDPVADYENFVDGKPRADGARSFLQSRGIELPEGDPGDPSDAPTVHGLSNRKNEILLRRIHADGVEVYPGSERYVRAVRAAGLRRAVVSSSANTHDVLAAAHIADLFEEVVDGLVAEREHLRGKPAPDTFLAGARALGLAPGEATVFEDALAGVAAGPGRPVRVRDRGGPPRAGGRTARTRRGRGGGRPRRTAGAPVIKHPVFRVEPWRLREMALDLDVLAQTESVFALSNGHIGWRGNLDEGEPHGLPGSYLNGVYEERPLPSAEAAYGVPQSGQTVINVTNGKLIRLFVDDEPFDVRYGTLREHERVLDFRDGVLGRRAEWVSPAGGAVRVSSTRLVSFTQRAIAAIRYEVEPLDGPVRIAVQSELLANEQLPLADRRPAARRGRSLTHWSQEFQGTHDNTAIVVHRTRNSGLRIGAAMDHLIDGPDPRIESPGFPDGGLVTATAVLAPGQRLSLIKFVAYGWSGARSLPAVRDQVWAALTARPADRLGRPAGRSTRLPRRLLGPRGRGDRRGHRGAAGGAVRAVPRAAGRCPRREPADPGEGPDRARVRRARLLGYRGLRAAGAHVHRARRGRQCSEMAPGCAAGRP